MGFKGKRLKDSYKDLDLNKVYSLEEAVNILQGLPKTRFDQTVEVALNLGVDPRHADQMVRGMCALPHGTGKKIRVIVFARDEKAKEAESAGADKVGAEDLIELVQNGYMDFDTVIATPDMMPLVSRLGKVLGPRGLMPNPKLGTVTPDAAKAVDQAKAGQVQFRVEKQGIIHAGVGKMSFKSSQLLENIRALSQEIQKSKPSGAKGTYMKKATLSATMSVGLEVSISSLLGS